MSHWNYLVFVHSNSLAEKSPSGQPYLIYVGEYVEELLTNQGFVGNDEEYFTEGKCDYFTIEATELITCIKQIEDIEKEYEDCEFCIISNRKIVDEGPIKTVKKALGYYKNEDWWLVIIDYHT